MLIVRVAAAIAGVLIVGGVVIWVIRAILNGPGELILFGSLAIAVLTCGGIVLYFAVYGGDTRVRRVLLFSLLFGSVCGAIGTVVIASIAVQVQTSNLGPLIYPLMFGPLTFVLGCAVGAWWLVSADKRRRERRA
jgi:hypothetical protein